MTQWIKGVPGFVSDLVLAFLIGLGSALVFFYVYRHFKYYKEIGLPRSTPPPVPKLQAPSVPVEFASTLA